MNTLASTQDEFHAYLLTGRDAVIARIVDSGRIDATTRLAIYANAYRLRLLEALETDFVAVRAVCGDEEFEQLGRAYIAAHPSRHYSLRWFGRHMAEFLRITPPYDRQPWLAELAIFEWALTDAFDAADSTIVGIDQVAVLAPTDWPRMQFTPHASLIRLDLRWNAPAIWKAVDQKLDSRPALAKSPDAVPWVIWRRDLQTYFRSLDTVEVCALDALRRGETFGAICEGLCELMDPGDVPNHAAGLLRRWIVDGMLHTMRLE